MKHNILNFAVVETTLNYFTLTRRYCEHLQKILNCTSNRRGSECIFTLTLDIPKCYLIALLRQNLIVTEV